MSKTLFIGAVASIIAINSVLADTTVTSKTFVFDHPVHTKNARKSGDFCWATEQGIRFVFIPMCPGDMRPRRT